MKTTPVTEADLTTSVLAVPPLARHNDLTLNDSANAGMVRYLEGAGVRTLLYGGNANLYHAAPSEYPRLLEHLAAIAGADTWVIPSVGPAYGTMMDQAEVVRTIAFPAIMVLPHTGPSTYAGVATGLRRFVERVERPIIVYLKQDGFLDVDHVRQLVDDGLVAAIKYAIVRPDPADDRFLQALCDAVDRRLLVSGIGERPAIIHMRRFGLVSFTSGSVCVAPRRSMELLRACRARDFERASALREAFLPLEDLRDDINPIRVLHDAVTLAGISDMGPVLPLSSNLTTAERERVEPIAVALRSLDEAAMPPPTHSPVA